MGYYRGVPTGPIDPNARARRLEKVAAKMRDYYLTHGTGCRSRALAIARRLKTARAGK